MAAFTSRALYGGAITCLFPSDYIDSSTLREIPSHQEVYLSPTNLTSIIVEINQFEDSVRSDAEAAIYHFKDVVDGDDRLETSTEPMIVRMGRESLEGFRAWSMKGMIGGREKGRTDTRNSGGAVLPKEWEETSTVAVQTMMYQLLIRMKSVETDLCVRINVPLKEFEGDRGKEEIRFAEECLERVVTSLDVRDFGLFGE